MYCSKCGIPNLDEAQFCKNCGTGLSVTASQVVSSAPAEVILPASLVQRLIHTIVDGIAMYIFAFIIGLPAVAIFGEEIGLVIGIIAFIAYFLVFEALFQQTVGKMLTKTKVVSLSGGKPSFLSLVGRTLARYVPFEALSFLFYGSYPTKGWHDRWSHTLVVPKNLTPEQVQLIDPERIKAANVKSKVSMVVLIVGGLLLVCAILGVFMSIVLASLNSARDNASDARTKSTLNTIRAHAEIYYGDNSESYEGLCNDPTTISYLEKVEDAGGTTTCNDNATAYAAAGSLNEGDYFCVDSLMFAESTDTSLANKTHCGGSAMKTTGNVPQGFIQYTSDINDFSVMFPSEPTADVQFDIPTNNDPDFTFDMRTYMADDGTNSYIIYSYTYSEPLELFDPNEALSLYLNAMVDDESQILSLNYGTKLGKPAVEYTVAIEDEEIQGVILIADDTLVYSLMYNYYPESYSQNSYDAFIDSFELH